MSCSANEKSLKVFLPGEGKFYVGKATKENLFTFFKVLISPGDMVFILAGLPPQIMEGNLSEYVVQSSGYSRLKISISATTPE